MLPRHLSSVLPFVRSAHLDFSLLELPAAACPTTAGASAETAAEVTSATVTGPPTTAEAPAAPTTAPTHHIAEEEPGYPSAATPCLRPG